MKVQGESKMQAHITSSVVVDIAAFKVSQSVGIDIDATSLRAARARSSSIHRRWMKCHMEGSKSKHTYSDASFSYTFELISVAVPEM